MTSSPEEINKFWFEEIDNSMWFNATPEFDTQLRERFEQHVEAALRGEFDEWCDTPEGSLALIILLDQFPLNMYRGKVKSFVGERKSIEVARNAIEKNYDQDLGHAQKAFMYMPFMHSENLNDQDFSVLLFERAGLKNNLRYARHHREIVRKYGRFPHRNKILNRESTEAELAYLKSEKAFLG